MGLLVLNALPAELELWGVLLVMLCCHARRAAHPDADEVAEAVGPVGRPCAFDSLGDALPAGVAHQYQPWWAIARTCRHGSNGMWRPGQQASARPG